MPKKPDIPAVLARVSSVIDTDGGRTLILEAVQDAACTLQFFGGEKLRRMKIEVTNAKALEPVACNDFFWLRLEKAVV